MYLSTSPGSKCPTALRQNKWKLLSKYIYSDFQQLSCANTASASSSAELEDSQLKPFATPSTPSYITLSLRLSTALEPSAIVWNIMALWNNLNV